MCSVFPSRLQLTYICLPASTVSKREKRPGCQDEKISPEQGWNVQARYKDSLDYPRVA
jgi:hypothetical protein